MKRIATISKLKPGKGDEYLAIHNDIPQEVVEAGHKYGLRNFTMYKIDDYLFSYFEYIGDNYEKDMCDKSKLLGQAEWQAVTSALKDLIDGKPAIILNEFWHNDF